MESKKITITQVNDLCYEEFVYVFGKVVEKYPQASEAVYQERPFQNVENLCNAFDNYLEDIPTDEKLKILRLHPVLGGKEAEKGELTKESEQEQEGAKLHTMDKEAKEKMEKFNANYLEKYGFPFIVCVAGHNPETLAIRAKSRKNNLVSEEIVIAIDEVKKICRLRILNLVESQ